MTNYNRMEYIYGFHWFAFKLGLMLHYFCKKTQEVTLWQKLIYPESIPPH